MPPAVFLLLPCVFALCYAGVLDDEGREVGRSRQNAGDGSCPQGAKCTSGDLCPYWAQIGRTDSLHNGLCGGSLSERVCCWGTAVLRRPASAPPPFGPPPFGTRPLLLPTAPSLSPRLVYRRSTPRNASVSAGNANTTVSSSGGGGSPSEKACQEYRKLQFRRKRRVNQLDAHHVVGGGPARLSEFPYMVAIGYARGRTNGSADLSWGCGGSLISDRYVLTAAHCITDAISQDLHPVALRMGVNHLAEGPRRPDDLSVEATVLHPRHSAKLRYFDLALLRTARSVTFSAAEHPVCLSTPATRVDGNTPLLVAGWGATDPAGFEMSADLKKAELRLLVLEECKKLIPQSSALPRGLDEGMICAAEPKREADTCRGDSGGPLVARVGGVDTLVGVTSFGGRPCGGRRPGVYARVAPQLQWIESVVWPSK